MRTEITRIAFLAAALIGQASCSGGVDGTAKPNIVLISLDNLSANHLGCYGYSRNTSPFLDALARNGTLFEQITAQETWTLPSHASMLSSRYVGAHGVWTMDSKLSEENLPLLQEVFRDGGYRTVAFTSCQFLTGIYGFDRGFDHFHTREWPAVTVNLEVLDFLSSFTAERFFLFLHYYDIHQPFSEKNPYGEDFEGDLSPETKAVMQRLHGFDGKRISDLSPDDIEWIRKTCPHTELIKAFDGGEGAPTMITYSHVKEMAFLYLAQAGEKEMECIKGAYDNGIAYLDKRLAELFDRLKEFPWYKNTVFVITADHGEAFNQHQGIMGHGGPPFDELSRVPLIITGAGILRNKRIETPFASTDIAPTLLDLADLSLPEGFQGRSLLPALRTGKSGSGSPVLSGSEEAQRMSYREGRWKLLLDMKREKTWLFDMDSPEGEAQDLSGTHPDRVAKLKEKLLRSEKYNRMLGSKINAGKVILSEESKARLRELGYLK